MLHFPDLQLTFNEARVLGCLLEKETLTPGSYPLTLNSLQTACNQSSSRDPITSLSGDEITEALRGLSENYLVTKILGGRTPKYEHCLPEFLHLQDSARAVLTVLLLRGQQTAGEIKTRTERMHHFGSLDEVEETLSWFIEYSHGPLVRRVPVGGGRRVESFVHLLSEVADDVCATSSVPAAASTAPPPAQDDDTWRADIESQIAALKQELAELKTELGQ